MYSIDLMMEEHQDILRVCGKIKLMCLDILDGKDFKSDKFYMFIDFVRNYADLHHHAKEELIFFKEMQTHLGAVGENLIKYGMLVEHDLGRLYIIELEKALENYDENNNLENKLDIIVNAMSYVNLLGRHIEKEDNLVYNFGKNNLGSNILTSIDERTKLFEEEHKEIRIKYKNIIEELCK